MIMTRQMVSYDTYGSDMKRRVVYCCSYLLDCETADNLSNAVKADPSQATSALI
jgi:hypothetical protein